MAGDPPPPETRLDVWLDVACLFKTRTEAQRACRGGKVEVNGQAAVKPHKSVRPGDEIRISRAAGRKQILIVVALADKHMAKAEARKLYVDRTPPPTQDELDRRAFERAYPKPLTAPNRRDQRALRRLKGQPD
jgi:ribosome-associated heat shock protein Hsp15